MRRGLDREPSEETKKEVDMSVTLFFHFFIFFFPLKDKRILYKKMHDGLNSDSHL